MAVPSDKPFVSPGELLELVEAVTNALPQDEAHWLEWKSQLNLSQRDGQATVAKFVLGAANRPSRVCNTAAGGYAYMVVGAEPSNLSGQVMPDPADLDNGLRRYLGQGGPLFSVHPVVFNGTEVVVVVVHPSPVGSRPFLCQKEFAGIVTDGGIYIRRSGSTASANSQEIREMLEEAKHQATSVGPPWTLELESKVVKPLVTVEFAEAVLDDWLSSERDRLTGSLLAPGSLIASLVPSLTGEPRTRTEFQQEVNSYLRAASEGIENGLLQYLYWGGLSRLRLRAHNAGDDTIANLIVEISLPNDVYAIGVASDLHESERMPSPPQPFGTGPMFDIPIIPLYVPGSGIDRSTGESGETILTYPRVEVRPKSRAWLPSITVLLPRALAGTTTVIGWRAHASNRRGVTGGEVLVGIPDETLTIADVLALEPRD